MQNEQARLIRELQLMLRQLADYYAFLPPVQISGIFDETTLEAVLLFQRELSPPVTGLVDEKTMSAIYRQWAGIEAWLAQGRALRAFPAEGCWVEPLREQTYMILPQMMFQVLSRYFSGIAAQVPDGIHVGASVENVRWLQRAAGMRESGILCPYSWELLCRLYEIFVVQEGSEPLPTEFQGGWG